MTLVSRLAIAFAASFINLAGIRSGPVEQSALSILKAWKIMVSDGTKVKSEYSKKRPGRSGLKKKILHFCVARLLKPTSA